MRRVALLEHENVIDALTSLYNRRYLDRRISTEYESARRYGHPLSVLMIDIDHFKQLNDAYGHRVGDLALRFMSELVLDGVRDAELSPEMPSGEQLIACTDEALYHAKQSGRNRVSRYSPDPVDSLASTSTVISST